MSRYFDYPLDSEYILRKKKAIKRELLENTSNFLEKRVAILGGSTTSEIKNILEIFLLNEGIKPIFYESEYNKFYEDALFSEELESFVPDVVYIHTNYRNIKKFPEIIDSPEEIEKLLLSEYERFEKIWQVLKEKFNCAIIQNNFDFPRNRIMGNYDRTSINGRINFIERLNMKFNEYAQNSNGFYINDINYLSAEVGLLKWEDLLLWYGYKYAISYEVIPVLCKSISSIIKALYGKNRKAVILDLDNTLWGGVIGDDGVNNLKIGTETAIGEAYTEFQKYIKKIKKLGVALAVASKNEESIAREGLNLNEMILKEKDFYSIKANWEPKFKNIQEIAKELNIGENSLLFIDDNPAERELVRNSIEGIAVPEVKDNIVEYIDHIDKNGYFEIIKLSNEDLKRNEFYEANKKREEKKREYLSYEDYLLSLKMKAEIDFVKSIYFDRIAQLTNKTNQFNLTTKRYSLSDIENIAGSTDKFIIYGRLKDKFGDNGLITVVICEIKEKGLHIDTWLMSCRVLKRDMEKAVFDFLVDYCKEKKLDEIYGYYCRTNKNMMVKDHYLNLGFECLEENEDSSSWIFKIKNNEEKTNKVIEIGEY